MHNHFDTTRQQRCWGYITTANRVSGQRHVEYQYIYIPLLQAFYCFTY